MLPERACLLLVWCAMKGEFVLKSPMVIVWTNRAWFVTLLTIGLVMVFLLVLTYVAVKINAPFSEAICGKTIVIDPGHGGIDAGAHGRSGLREKDVVLTSATFGRLIQPSCRLYDFDSR